MDYNVPACTASPFPSPRSSASRRRPLVVASLTTLLLLLVATIITPFPPAAPHHRRNRHHHGLPMHRCVHHRTHQPVLSVHHRVAESGQRSECRWLSRLDKSPNQKVTQHSALPHCVCVCSFAFFVSFVFDVLAASAPFWGTQ